MDRLACIDLPALPLQLLLRRQPAWRRLPAAVVAEDRPQGRILWVNEHARRRGVLPGMRYAAGLGLTHELGAGVVPAREIEAAVAELVEALHHHSPDVEPAGAGDPGVFWVNAAGLGRLHPSLEAWAEGVHAALARRALAVRIAVGFTRFGTLAIVRSPQAPDIIVVASPATESALARDAPLDRLALDPAARDTLAALGVRRVGELMALPPTGVRRRFGDDVFRLHREATGDLCLPLAPQPETQPLVERLVLDHAETDRDRLLFQIKRLLHPLLDALSARQQALAELTIDLELEGAKHEAKRERLRPASPTLDAHQLLQLVRLRLEGVELGAGVVELAVAVGGVIAIGEQLDLFATARPRRDRSAAERALARVRAEFGEAAVVHAVQRAAHLPEASFAWAPWTAFRSPPAGVPSSPGAKRQLVRRFFVPPHPFPGDPRRQLEKRDGRGAGGGGGGAWSIDALVGPYVISGGWWRTLVERHYHFAHRGSGEWLWIYYDARRRRWFVQGRVE